MKHWMLPFQNETKSKCTRKMPHVFAFIGSICVLYVQNIIYIWAREYSLRARHKRFWERERDNKRICEWDRQTKKLYKHTFFSCSNSKIVNLFQRAIVLFSRKMRSKLFDYVCILCHITKLGNSKVKLTLFYSHIGTSSDLLCQFFFPVRIVIWVKGNGDYGKIFTILLRHHRQTKEKRLNDIEQMNWKKWKKISSAEDSNRKIWSSAPDKCVQKSMEMRFPRKNRTNHK